MPSQSGPSNHCLSGFLWSSTAVQFIFKNCLGCVVWNYSCQKPRVCLFMILTQLGLNLVIPPFSCHFLHIHMVVECIQLPLSSMLHLHDLKLTKMTTWIWKYLKLHTTYLTFSTHPLSLSIQCLPQALLGETQQKSRKMWNNQVNLDMMNSWSWRLVSS